MTLNNLPIPSLDLVKYLCFYLDKRLTLNNILGKSKRLSLNGRLRALIIFLTKINLQVLKLNCLSMRHS